MKSAVDYFRVKAAKSANLITASSQRQAVDALARFVQPQPLGFDDITESLLGEWIMWLFYEGYTYNTIGYYLKHISSLYGKAVKEGLAQATDAFADIKARLREASPLWVEMCSDAECFDKLRQLVQKDCSQSAIQQLAKDLTLFAVYNGGLTFSQLVGYKKLDYKGDDPAILEIVGRYARPKNKYLFPLKQSERTPKQLSRAVTSLFSEALQMVNIRVEHLTEDIAGALWVATAMRTGVALAEIVACISSKGYEFPMAPFFCTETIEPQRMDDIRRYVVGALTKDPYNWYAMQFRPHVTYDMLKERLSAEHISLKNVFYPMEEIVRRIGARMVCESKPVVPGLLFFQSKATELADLFRNIGDLAWGYRQTKNPRSPYAIIRPLAIHIYQQTIGQFTADTQVFPAGTIELAEGDRLEVIGGHFIGRPAIFDSAVTSHDHEGQRVIYRLKMIGQNDIEWIVNTDSRLVRKISEERFKSLTQSFR